MNNSITTSETRGRFARKRILTALLGLTLFAPVVSCGGGGGGGEEVRSERSGIDAANFNCDGTCPNQNLSAAEVARILSQAVTGAQLLGLSATIAVTDRVGNVLGVYQMDGAPTTTTITGGRAGLVGGLEGLTVPATLAAISKAGTGCILE